MEHIDARTAYEDAVCDDGPSKACDNASWALKEESDDYDDEIEIEDRQNEVEVQDSKLDLSDNNGDFIENSPNYTIKDYIVWIFLALLILVAIRFVTGAKRRAIIGLIIGLFGFFGYYKDNIIGIFLFVAIIILVIGRKKKSPQWKISRGERRPFSEEVRERVLKHQKYKCADCDIKIYQPLIHLDHINGNRSDNRLANCQALCPNCHALKTDEDRRRQ